MTSSGAVTGQVKTGTSRPSAKKPTAKCAIGEILITTGGADDASCAESPAMQASWHRSPDLGRTRDRGRDRDLTFDQYGGYRRGAMNTFGELVVIRPRVGA